MTLDTQTTPERRYFPYGFPLSEIAWRGFHLETAREGGGEHAIPERVRAVRTLVNRMNAQRDFSAPGVKPARAGELLAIDLIQEILRHLTLLYAEEHFPGVLARGLRTVASRAGAAVAELPLPLFVRRYPPLPVRMGQLREGRFLAGGRPSLSNRESTAAEILLLQVALENPAMRPYAELFEDPELYRGARTADLLRELDRFLEEQPPVPELDLKLPAALRAPMRTHPDSLEDQLEFIRTHWAKALPPGLLDRLHVARGVLREETALRGLGPGPALVPRFGVFDAEHGYPEPEAFSPDTDWMPNVVLLAKTSYVWLDQLSKRYRRPITRLDEVPDEELDRLRAWGFNALWLIGLWERSVVSQDIKQRMGNPEAAASAYSLYDYMIAHDLGGEAAYRNLAERAGRRGIRLASDMVPNHVGIYSRWIAEHPDWFIQVNHPPYPAYQFTGPNLSPDSRITIQIEDGYWERRDAAVVFKRIDNYSGETRYIYHGNDGTSMPWNDTAQLNFLIPAVREAVIQTILHVARMFPIIRFDAAMTLAKKHFQRLWFPKPGDEGAVPSRSEHGMSREAFDQVFPKEFWREVVDRVAAEAPGTLLLAEAFWLMEGYFVRTLGMHRVYNSAFMNMLKLEENAKYRQTIKNVLEFSPEILQRFVNFMNNPDEQTAVEQFGKGDKYFGCCVLMATMPGLPMFGHGQFEGFSEKYGMEYRRAYWDEPVDEHLVHRHEAEICPLLHRRHLFSGARHFALFDFESSHGGVNENVFAYTNRSGGGRALVVYNNAYDHTWGRLRMSTAINRGAATAPHLERTGLAAALELDSEPDIYYICRDTRTGLEYLQHGQSLAEHGLSLHLDGYQYCVFVDWRELRDTDLSWGRLHGYLEGRGVPSMREAYQELVLAPVLEPFRDALAPAALAPLLARNEAEADFAPFAEEIARFLAAAAAHTGANPGIPAIVEDMRADWEAMRRGLKSFEELKLDPEVADYIEAPVPPKGPEAARFWRTPLLWAVLRHIGKAAAPAPAALDAIDWTGVSAAWMSEWFLVKAVARALERVNGRDRDAYDDARLVKACIAHNRMLPQLQGDAWGPGLHALFNDPEVRAYLQMHEWGGRTWMAKERFESLLHRLFLTWAATLARHPDEAADWAGLCHADLVEWRLAAQDANYDAGAILAALK